MGRERRGKNYSVTEKMQAIDRLSEYTSTAAIQDVVKWFLNPNVVELLLTRGE